MNKARAMLDALMGPGRDEAEGSGNTAKFKDRTVCKSFLIGFCCRDKNVLGGKPRVDVCSKIHSDTCKQQFEESDDAESFRKDCVIASLRDMDNVLRDTDRFIVDKKAELKEEARRKRQANRVVLADEICRTLRDLKKGAKQLIDQAEALDDNDYKSRETLMTQANELNLQHDDMFKNEVHKALEKDGFEEMCDVCGTVYKGNDDYENHLKFKVHQGWQQTRGRIEELRKQKEQIEKEKVDERKASRNESSDKADDDKNGDGKRRGRSRNGDRGRDRSRDRRDRSRSRGGDRGGRDRRDGGRDGRHRSRSRSHRRR